MAVLVLAVQLITGAPMIINSNNELTVSLSIANLGLGAAANVKVTSITLGWTTRLSPADLPQSIGYLAPSNTASVYSRFDSRGLAVGGRYLLTVQGTYETNGATYGFAVNRSIIVPSPSEYPLALLKARVDVAVAPGVWTYTIFNDEPLGSPYFIMAFALGVVAPVTVTGVPQGWEVEANNPSNVFWIASDQQLPYPHHIAPGSSLGGFQIQSASRASESTAYAVIGWNHQTDAAGLVFFDSILSPSTTK